MTINTETIRDAAEVLDTLTSTLAVDHPLRTRAAARAKSCVSGLYSAADALDAQTAEIAEAKGQIEHLDRQNAGLRAQHDQDSKTLREHAQAQSSGNASDEPEWLQSLRLEARDLSDHLDRLSRFRDTAGFRMLTDTDQGLLDRQGNQMHALLQTLNQRIHSGAGQHQRSKSHD